MIIKLFFFMWLRIFMRSELKKERIYTFLKPRHLSGQPDKDCLEMIRALKGASVMAISPAWFLPGNSDLLGMTICVGRTFMSDRSKLSAQVENLKSKGLVDVKFLLKNIDEATSESICAEIERMMEAFFVKKESSEIFVN